MENTKGILTPERQETGRLVETPRGRFSVTAMSKEQMEVVGYGVHHQSVDGRYLIMGNGTDAFAVDAFWHTQQAENLPEGWYWWRYRSDDGDYSDYLKSPDGKEYFDYDCMTGEYKITQDRSYDFWLKENYETGTYSIGSFAEFKQYVEQWINNNIIQSGMPEAQAPGLVQSM